MNPLKRFAAFIQTPGHTRTLTALVILIIAAAVPLTVLVAQQQQNIKQKAAVISIITCTTPSYSGICSTTACSGTGSTVNTACQTYSAGTKNYCCPATTTTTPTKSSTPTVTCQPIPCCYWAIGKLHCLPPISENSCPETTIPPLRCSANTSPTPTPYPCSNGMMSWQLQNLCADGASWTGGSYKCTDGTSGQITSTTCVNNTILFAQALRKCANSPKICPSIIPTQTPIPTSSPTPPPGCYYQPIACTAIACIQGQPCPTCSPPKLICPSPSISPTPTPPITIVPNCNSGYFCNNICSSSQANTCSNNGTQTCYYKTSTTGQVCSPVSVYPSCSVNNCSNGYSCSSIGTCVSQSTPTPTQIASVSPSPTSSSTPIPSGICVTGNMKCVGQQVQECNNGVWENNNTGCSIHSTTPVALCINCITPSSSPKPTPTSTPTPSPTPTPIPGNTYLTLVVGMDGVGNAGTHQNPIPAGTQNPAHTQRKVYLTVRDSNNNEVPVGNEMFIYDSQDGLFIGTVSVGTNPGIKNYTIKVKSDGHLAKLIPGIQVITAGIFNPPIPRIDLTAGDINGDNIIDIKDYNILLSCMSDPDITSLDGGKLCNTDLTFKTVSDLDDNGTVDKFDSNLFLGEYSVQSGN